VAEVTPAPEPLEQIRAFVNTLDVDVDEDALGDPGATREWLVAHGFLDDGARVSKADHARVVELRDALRALVMANNGKPVPAEAVATLNAVSGHAPLAATFDTTGTIAVTGQRGGVDGALGELLAIVVQAVSDDTWSRLKVCREDTCQWAFYDRSRNRSAQWCVMAVCGNRNKARAYRARKAD
jgi:predicted RNA-binding Zn ribbon-like protein